MRGMMMLFVGVVLGGGLVWGSMNYHVLRTDEGLVMIHKKQASLADAYYDVRQWGVADWSAHPDLAWSLHQSGRSDIFERQGVLADLVQERLRGA